MILKKIFLIDFVTRLFNKIQQIFVVFWQNFQLTINSILKFFWNEFLSLCINFDNFGKSYGSWVYLKVRDFFLVNIGYTIYYNITNFFDICKNGYFSHSNHLKPFLKFKFVYSVFWSFFFYVTSTFKLIYKTFPWIYMSLVVVLVYVYSTVFYIKLHVFRFIIIWLVVCVAVYLLFVIFNTILKRYQYGKFTSGVQRLWKKIFMFFWLLEFYLFFIFYFYYLNSSAEACMGFDLQRLFKKFLLRVEPIYLTNLYLIICLLFVTLLVYKINFLSFKQYISILFIVFSILCYCLYIELYQFYYILNNFILELEELTSELNLWVLEEEEEVLRVKTQYFLLCPVIKFWHFFFVFINWVFLISRSFLTRKINYNLLGYNLQNLNILNFLNWTILCQYLIFLTRFFSHEAYSFFYLYDEFLLNDVLADIYSYYYDFFNYNIYCCLTAIMPCVNWFGQFTLFFLDMTEIANYIVNYDFL